MRKTRILALVLAVVCLAGLFAACAESSPEATTAAPAGTEPAAEATEGAATEAPEETETVVLDGNTPVSFPLSEEEMEFTLWSVAGPLALAGMEDYNESEFYKRMEELTNVHIDFTLAPAGEEMTNFNIILASGEYMDAFACPDARTFYVGGLDKALEDGIIIPLEDYSEYFPNYNYRRSVEDLTLYNSVTPSGHIAALFQMKIPQPTYQGPVIRADLLESYGWEGSAADITTLAEWEEVLELFAVNGVATPWWGEGNFMLGLDQDILPAFGIYNLGLLYQLDDVVKFGPAEESFYDYLELYSRWYANGYISKDFTSHENDINGDEPGEMTAGRVGIGVIPQASFDQINSETDGSWTGIPLPVQEEGQLLEATYLGNLSRSYFQSNALSISTDCAEEKIPVILQWFDYLFSDEGSMLANWDVEGVSYHLNDAGKPEFESFVTDGSEGYSLIGQLARYCCFHVVPFLYDYQREQGALSEEAAALPEIWESNYAEELDEYPNLSVPTDISEEYNSMYNELVTYAEEYALRVITGAEDLESSWETYQETLNQLGLQEVLSIQQEAYDLFYETDVTVGMPG